ncbi:MAG: TatD family hydrolase [Thermoleophilia bacterium]
MDRFTDAHTHLDHCEPAADELIERARSAGVDVIVQSGTDAASSRWAIELAATYPEVWATVGTHPHDAKAVSDAELDALAGMVDHPRVLAVGETGLDFYRDHSPRVVQEAVFRGQLEIARAADLPVVVHTRAADEQSLAILQREAADRTVVLHCFSMPDRLDEVVGRGYYLSLAGNVTYKNAAALKSAAARIPDELLLVETDAPWLTPVPQRGRPNEPALVPHIYHFLAEVRDTSVSELAAQVRRNLIRAFPRLAGGTGA